MKKLELESILNKARLPEISGESLEKFSRQVAGRIHHEGTTGEPEGWSLGLGLGRKRELQRWIPKLAWGYAAAVCIILAAISGQWRKPTEPPAVAANDSVASLKLIRETLALFPHQVRAIVEDAHGLKLVLSDTDNVPASPPLYIRICDGQNCSSFVTFSGQEIQVAGLKITVLTDGRGGIILAGNQFVWSNTERTYAGSRLKIEAKNLGAMAM